jgi:uncharacterized protein YbaR (Trm112 family)/SAM-dependent methyltransferase
MPDVNARTVDALDRLACPRTKQPLIPCTRADAERRAGEPLRPLEMDAEALAADADLVLLRADGRRAYPVLDGIPLLMGPEALVPDSAPERIDVTAPQYAEAYEERDYYDAVAEPAVHAEGGPPEKSKIELALGADARERETFPEPRRVWLDMTYDCVAQHRAYAHLTPLADARAVQIGGSGGHALTLLAAGAAEAWLVTPVLGEARLGVALAERAGHGERFHAVVGVGEELPFPDGSLDIACSAGSLHHTVTALSLPEAARVLTPGGRFAAIDPWRAALYGIGTSIFGKREPNVHCRPLTPERVAPLSVFSWSCVSQHGPLTRYPLLALSKLGVEVTLERAWRIMSWDDRIVARYPRVRRQGSSVALLGTK